MSTGKDKASVVSLGGTPIFHHDDPAPFAAPQGEECIAEIAKHIEAHFGKVGTVFHEIVSDTVHIDVHFVKATEDFPFIRIVTSGMSDLPMAVPEDVDAPKYIELVMTLPGDWQMDQESFADENWYWPIRLIKGLARLPHKFNTWLGYGHTVPNGDPAEPYAANAKLNGAIILPVISAPDEFHTLRINDDKEIAFYAVVPLYEEEMNCKLRLGSDELLDKLSGANISDIIDPQRRNVAKKRLSNK